MDTKKRTALLSVYNKKDLEIFAKELVALDWQIVSSGGTAKYLKENGIEVVDVADLTGMPAILSHRVATLHPKIHGGLLALDTEEHRSEMQKYNIPWIDMVCVDFYPLKKEIEDMNSTSDSVIEKTDIGGPTMIRAGAKGGRIVICDFEDRLKVIDWLKAGEPEKEKFLKILRAKAEFVVAEYSATSGEYHSDGEYKSIFGVKDYTCAYGENAYQKPAFFYKRNDSNDTLAIEHWKQVGGSPMSYNNLCDLDRMIQTTTHIGAGFEKNLNKIPFIAIGVKHGNPCGAGVSFESEIDALEKMLLGDLRAIFGGMVMLNFPVTEKIAEEVLHKYTGEGKRLLDMVAGPSFTEEAIEILSRKKGKCRLVQNIAIQNAGQNSLDTKERTRCVRGGFLVQPNYIFVPDLMDLAVVKHKAEDFDIKDVILAWAVGSTSNSNTITIVKEGRLCGNGVGQQDRVGASKLAIARADDSFNFMIENNLASDLIQNILDKKNIDLKKATAYSDSFFPFNDAPEILIERGVNTIFTTSGSVNDEMFLELAKNKQINVIMLPDAEARGFYQH
ncbi:MAG: hypothetical protein K9L98_00700 [Candidatus Pacebacteria bacterium]|nr:hypothetical protein [Candidatus Paceibacterota bacterium]MCF7862518.1 hypothetical protein [Candidatus Paceibacterota bacterium]